MKTVGIKAETAKESFRVNKETILSSVNETMDVLESALSAHILDLYALGIDMQMEELDFVQTVEKNLECE